MATFFFFNNLLRWILDPVKRSSFNPIYRDYIIIYQHCHSKTSSMVYSNSYMFLGIGLFVILSSQALANHMPSEPLNHGKTF
jgi:hypothetical protein